jgi:hypothetical protein
MNTANNSFIKTITNTFADDLTPLPDMPTATATNSINTSQGFFSNFTWQTWLIIILILGLLGINIFAYLAKGTQVTANIFDQIVTPFLKLFGYSTLETTKQTLETTATGTNATVNAVTNTGVGAINTVEQTVDSTSNINTIPTNLSASTTLQPVQNDIQQTGGNVEQWQQNSLQKALDTSSQSINNVQPDESKSSIQTIGKSGWCYIGEDQGTRTCAEIGVNDMCMSGDVFPTQEICMNPNLRA